MKSLLLVDDDDACRNAFREFLELEGFAVHVAADAYEAVQKLNVMRFDAVVTDLMLPGSGHAVVEYVHTNQPQTPVIIVSAYEVENAKLSQATFARLTKPVDPTEIVRVIMDACAH